MEHREPADGWLVREPPPGASDSGIVRSAVRRGPGREWGAALGCAAGAVFFGGLALVGLHAGRPWLSVPVLLGLAIAVTLLVLGIVLAWHLRRTRDVVVVADHEGVRLLGPTGWYLRWDEVAWLVPQVRVGEASRLRIRLRDGVDPRHYQRTILLERPALTPLVDLANGHGVPERRNTTRDVVLDPIAADAVVVSDVRTSIGHGGMMGIVLIGQFVPRLFRMPDYAGVWVVIGVGVAIVALAARGAHVRIVADATRIRREGGLRPWSFAWAEVAGLDVGESAALDDQARSVRRPVETVSLSVSPVQQKLRTVRVGIETAPDFVRLARAHGVRAGYHVELVGVPDAPAAPADRLSRFSPDG